MNRLSFTALLFLWTALAPAAEPLRALIVGGGPDPASNAAQIESHVRFVASLLPAGTRRRLLFADGKTDAATVAAADPNPGARTALSLLLPNSGLGDASLMRPPQLGARPDGPVTHEALRRSFSELAPRSAAPLLLYFAGHGSRDEGASQVSYAMWNNEDLSVRDLAAEIARVPPKTPIVLVMAQCYSGGFADLLFHNGDPKSEPAPQNIAGFFSARQDRTASGCGVGTAAEDYQDFSSYFFGAIAGHDRFGKPVHAAAGDGRVTLHEAFCYALGHDESFDTPVCTSDVFLERYANLPDHEIFPLPYPVVYEAATPAQRAALDLLSGKLGAAGDARALAIYDRLKFQDPIGRPAQLTADRQSADRLSELRETTLSALFAKWPALRWSGSPSFPKAAEEAARALDENGTSVRDVLSAIKAHDDAGSALDNEEAWLMRFADLYRSIARAKHLRENGEGPIKAHFERLWEAENAVLPLAK